MTTETSPPSGALREIDVLIVGAGFAGLYALHRLRGSGFDVQVCEAGAGVGGTWYWNRYPGARCDVESLQYSYSFSDELQQEWVWSERYARQAEILRYLDHVADRFDLRRDIRLDTRVASAVFDEAHDRWTVRTDAGDGYSARYCVMATGCLSRPKEPDIPGVASFAGRKLFTSSWPHTPVDLAGLRVGIIGTGSTGIQAIPVLAEQAASLTVFQRTPNFSVPAQNAPLAPAVADEVKRRYGEIRAAARETPGGIWRPPRVPTAAMSIDDTERTARYEAAWDHGGPSFQTTFTDLLTDARANGSAAEFVRGKIRASVADPAVAEALCPKDHPLGTKRICVDSGYFDTYNRPNVRLVDLRANPIREITPTGLRTAGEDHAFDVLVFATGFDAMTGALLAVDIRGTGGRSLRAHWGDGPRSYLGLAIAGFPNLFIVTGPGSPSVLTNMVVSIEHHVEWIDRCLVRARAAGQSRVEVDDAAEEAWMRQVDEVARTTLFGQANSWYVGANVQGKKRVFMPYVGGLGNYRQLCDRIETAGYTGFRFSSAG